MNNLLKSTSYTAALIIIGCALSSTLLAQYTANPYASNLSLVKEALLGQDMNVSGVIFRGARNSRGSFTCADCAIDMKEGVVLSTGTVDRLQGPSKNGSYSGMNNTPGDNDLEVYARGTTFDAAVLEFDFVANSEIMSFRYIFGSEEYDEYVGSPFNDVFAFILTDKSTDESTNLATLPSTNIPVTINTINYNRFDEFYIPNQRWQASEDAKYTIELDGFTQPLVAYAKVVPGKIYHIKIGIADVNDAHLDSGVFIEGGSFKSQSVDEFIAENETYFETFQSEMKELNMNPVPDEIALIIKKKSDPVTAQQEVTKQLDSAPTQQPKETNSQQSSQETQPVKSSATTQEVPALVIHFPLDVSAISTEEQQNIDVFLSNIEDMSAFTFQVNGHTDNNASKAYNVVLSQQRADEVKKYLLSKGVSASKIVTKGYNYAKPVASNTTEEGQAQNRRVEIKPVL